MLSDCFDARDCRQQRLEVPGQQFVNAVHRMVGDTFNDVVPTSLRIAGVQAGRADRASLLFTCAEVMKR